MKENKKDLYVVGTTICIVAAILLFGNKSPIKLKDKDTTPGEQKTLDLRDIQDFYDNPEKYNNYYVENLPVDAMGDSKNSINGYSNEEEIEVIVDRDVIRDLKRNDKYDDLHLKLYDSGLYASLSVNGTIKSSKNKIKIYADEVKKIENDDVYESNPIYREIKLDKEEFKNDEISIKFNTMYLSTKESFLSLEITNNSDKKIAVKGFEDGYYLDNEFISYDQLEINMRSDEIHYSNNTIAPNETIKGEIAFRGEIDDRVIDNIKFNMEYIIGSDWDGYSDSSALIMDKCLEVILNENEESIEVKEKEINIEDLDVDIDGDEINEEVKILSFAFEEVLLSVFENPGKDYALKESDIDFEKALAKYEATVKIMKDPIIRKYGEYVKGYLVEYKNLLEAKVNNDEAKLKEIKDIYDKLDKENEELRFEMFMRAYDPSEYIDYVLTELLGISFKHLDDLRNIEFKTNDFYNTLLNMLEYDHFEEPNINNALHTGIYILEKRSLEELYYTADAGKMSAGKYINEKYVNEFNKRIK